MNMQYAARSVAHTSDIIVFFSKLKQACNPIESTLTINGKYNESDQPNGWNIAQACNRLMETVKREECFP